MYGGYEMRSVRLEIRVPEDISKDLEKFCRELDLSKQKVMMRLIRNALKLDKPEKIFNK